MAGEQTIDELNIKINSEASKSSTGMDKLIASIEKLKTVTGGGVGNLTGIAGSLQKLTSMLSGMKSQSGIVSSLANSINKLNDAKTDRISGSISTLTSSLKSLGGMDSNLKSIISDLATLAKSGTGSVSENALKLQAQAAKTQATIDQSTLKSAKAQQGLQAIAEKNRQIEETARLAAQQEGNLLNAYNQAKTAALSNVPAETSDLGKVMPDYTEEAPVLTQAALNSHGAPYRIEDSVNSLKAAIGETGSTAANAMGKVSAGSSRAAGFVDKLKQSVSTVRDRISEMGNTSNKFFSLGRFYGIYFIIRQIASTFAGFINNINSYVENMNLFDVAMGSSAQSGEKLAQSLQDVLGIDAGEAARNMGLFKQLTSSMGTTAKASTTMAENLTQLGYDIASFYNISTEAAFSKLQSGITGQVRAIRELGIDTSNARLQQELYNLGINEKVRNLTEADKAELRYIAVMKQTTNAQGDMARTILTPANALRILQAQLQITGRAIGSIFIPALLSILPPITAVIEVIGDLASELASMLGFKMPKIDYSSLKDITNGADDASDAVGGIGSKAQDSKKQLDNLIGGFDELHIVQKDTGESAGTGAGTGAGAGGNLLSGIDLPSYDALANAVSGKIDALKKKILGFLDAFKKDPLKAFADALWGVNGAFSELGKWLSALNYADVLNGITAALIGFGLTKNPLLAIAIGAVATAVSRFLPYKSKIDLLNGSLIALGGALALKAFTGMPFKLALGISMLLESGLVELLGTENAINLLTSALTGLGVGMLAFSFTGNLPLAVGIGTVAAAMSSLSIHFSDMQIAPALLSGVASGLVAFKLGLDSWAAGAAGLGIAITTFAELNDLSPGLRAGLLGVAGAVTALGLAFQAGFGPQGLIIAAIAGAFVGIAVGIKQAQDAAEKADLAKRFGDIALSASEVEDIADRLTTTPWTIKIDAAITANDKLKDMEKTIRADVEALNKLNWKVSIGMQLTKGEISDYKTTITSFINDAKAYVQQQQYSVTLAINASLTPGSDTQKNLLQFVNSYYGGAQKQLNSLGKQLSDEVNKAFSDNVLTEGEYLKISEIEQKMQKLIDKISDAEYKAKLDNLTADVSGEGITPDSFKDLQKQIQKAAQDRLAKADTVRLKAKAAAELKLDEDGNKAAYDKAVAEIQETYNQQKSKIDLTGLDVSLDTLNSKFSSELKAAEPIWGGGVKEAFKNGFGIGFGSPEEMFKAPLSTALAALQQSYTAGINKLNISEPAKENLAQLVSNLQPTEDDLKQIAASSLAAGQAVPDNVAKGIADIEKMKAISGNTDAIKYMIGANLSTDSNFLKMLATAKDAGKNVDANVAQGLTDSLPFVKDSATGTIIGIRDSITGKTTEITPVLRQNLKDMGVDIASNGLTSGINSQVPAVITSGENLIGGLNTGINNKKKSLFDNLYEISGQPSIIFNQQNGIHSPSTVMESSGENLVQGLWNGMQTKWDDFIGWWGSLHIPTPHLEFGYEELSEYTDDNMIKWAARKLGFKQIPTLDIDWRASGGAFGAASVIGVGEYPGASSNPEVVAPQSIIRATVEESNGNVVAVLSRILDVAEKIAEKDTTVNLDGEKISENTNKRNANRGYNLGLQST